MRLISRIVISLLAGIIGTMGFVALAQSSSPPDPWAGLSWSKLPVMKFGPGDLDKEGYYVQKTEAVFADYMWRSFIALMWPMEPGVVWETHASPGHVLISSKYWPDYPDWPGLQKPEPKKLVELKKKHCDYLPDTPQAPNGTTFITLQAINLPSNNVKSPVGPLLDRYSEKAHYVRAQVMMNERFFDYIKTNRYYDASKQAEDVRNGELVQLPYDDMNGHGKVGMIETKAAWMVLAGPKAKQKHRERYYTRWAYLIPSREGRCSKALVGLVAFHIHRLNKLGHAAATFEQVDNVEAPAGITPSFNPTRDDYGNKGYHGVVPAVIHNVEDLIKLPAPISPIANISRATPILPLIRDKNREYQNKVEAMPGTSKNKVLKHYQLIGTQHAAGFCRMKIAEGKKLWKPEKADAVITYKDGTHVEVKKGCPIPNVDDLINVALEPNTQRWNPQTQKGELFSCQGCHSYARPCCVAVKDTNPHFEVMSYLLSKAWFPKQSQAREGYTCSEPPIRFESYCRESGIPPPGLPSSD